MKKQRALEKVKNNQYILLNKKETQKEFNIVSEYLEEFFNSEDDFIEEYYSVEKGYFIDNEEFKINKFLLEKGYTIEFFDKKGGEGQGDEYYSVYQVVNIKNNTCFYIMWYGYYSSYDGVEWGKVIK